MKNKIYTKIILSLMITAALVGSFAIGASAEEAITEVVGDGEMTNVFEEIYLAAEANADKIFSALAFVGTLIVGAMYKSGLLPLLTDALARFKGTLDGIKLENERYESLTGAKIADIGGAIKSIENSIDKTNRELGRIESSLACYEEALKERENMKIILSAQIDMLYSIFMSSSLPQFEKEEIGNRITRMREELNSYESIEQA